MADLKKLPEIIETKGMTVIEFSVKLWPHLSTKTVKDRSIVGQQFKRLINGKSIKLEVLQEIANITGATFNTILNYEK